MKTIAISGIIGWDVTAKDIRSELDKAKGEDIEVQVSSPGGLVTDGLEIYNLIKNYEGNKSSRLMGLAASMASYIVLAGDKVIAEDNAIYMIHNAMGIAWGDKNTMQKMSDILAGFSRIFAKAYARKSGKSIKEIEDLMDDETFYFGQEILDEGFVDEIVPAPEDAEKDKAAMLSMAMAQIEQCENHVRKTETMDHIFKIAAILKESPINPSVGVEGGFSAEDIAAAAKAGLSVADLRKYGPIPDGDPQAINGFSTQDILVARKMGLTVEDLKKYGPKN